jgi:DNA-binding MarR family transcriptional regulator
LETSGLVKRSRRPSDERVVEITLTDAGRDKVDSWRLRRREALRELLAQLEPGEREELARLVGRLLSLTELDGPVPAR